MSIGSGNVTFGGGSNTGVLTFNGATTLTGTVTWTLSSGTPVTFANSISGSGFGLIKAGTGTLTFSGATANTCDGLTTINTGELDLNKTAGVTAIAGNLTIGDGTLIDTVKLLASNQIADTSAVQIDGTSGLLNLNNNNETIASLADRTGGTGTSGAVQLGSGTLTISPASGSTTFSGVISGSGNLVKSGGGTQVLSGASTYSGTTTISTNGGTLTLDNNNTTTARLANTSGITVNSGGTLLLSQSGVVSTDRINNSGTLTLAGGTFNLGGKSEGTVGTAGIGALTLTANSTLDFGTTGTSNLVQFAGRGHPYCEHRPQYNKLGGDAGTGQWK